MRAVVVALLGVALASCGGDGSAPMNGDAGLPGADAGPGEDGAPVAACGPGEIECGGECVDASDPAHCGRCGHACDSGQSCDRGTCVSACPGHELAVASPQLPIGADPVLVATGHFDGDDLVDAVALANGGGTILLGTEAGFFRVAGLYDVPSEAELLATGDVDGDGRDDIVVSDAELHVLLSRGDGTFTHQSVEGFTFAEPLAADFDGDGRLDLAVPGSGSLALYFGEAGGLSDAVVQSFGYATVSAAADVDQDGDVDLVYHDRDDLVVMANDGAGAFSLLTATPAPAFPIGLAVGDFAGDDAVDVLVAEEAGVTLYAGSGAGSFGPPTAVDLEPYRRRQVADVDGDGKDDLVESAGAVCVRRGSEAGLSPPRCVTTPGGAASGLALTDLDGDGALDAVVADDGSTGSLGVLRGRADGSFDAPVVVPLGSYTRSSTVADFDGDGRPDLVSGQVYEQRVTAVGVAGDGTLARIASFSTGGQPQSVVVADLDGGALDLVVGTHRSVEILLGAAALGSGATALVTDDVVSRVERVAVADVDGDGLADLAVLDDDSTRVRVLRATAPGTFAAAASATVELGDNANFDAGDVNGDGRADLVLSSDNEILVYPGQAGGTLGAPIVSPGSGTSRPHLADLDGDGDVDVLFDGIWWQGDGTGAFASPQIVKGYSRPVWIGDLDGDGRTDLLLRGLGGLAWARGGAAGFAIAEAWHLGDGAYTAVAADADGDGHLDLWVSQSGGARLVRGVAGGFDLPAVTPVVASLALARGDFDEDGRDDLVVRGNGSEIHVLLAEGTAGVTTFRTALIVPSSAPVHAVDADLDGHLDVVVDAVIYRGDGMGGFAEPVDPPVGAARSSSIGFVDGDAYPDLVVQSQVVGMTRIWFGGPDGFRQGPELPRSIHACVGDVDGDGVGDLVTAELTFQITVAHGLGDGTFAAAEPVGLSAGITAAVTCADVDVDGIGDVIATDVAPIDAAESRTSYALLRGGDGAIASIETVDVGFDPGTVDLGLLTGGDARSLILGGYFFAVADLDGALRTGAALVGPAVSGDYDGDGVLDVAVGARAGIVTYRGTCR